MHVSKSLRRLAVVVGTTSLLGTVPFAAPVFATNGTATPTPNARAANSGEVAITVATTHEYLPGTASVTVARDGAAADTIPLEGPAMSQGSRSVTFTIDTTNVNPGKYDIQVSGGVPDSVVPDDTHIDSCDACFDIFAPAPVVSSASPSSVGGNGAKFVTFAGQNFTTKTPYCTVSCGGQPTIAVVPSTGITLATDDGDGNDAAATTTTSITRHVRVAAGATPGPRDVVVTNTDGKSDTCEGCFVVGPTPTLAAASPAAIAEAVSGKTVVITGTNFDPNAFLAIKKLDGTASGVTFASKTWNSPTQITLNNVAVQDNQTADFQLIEIANPDGGYVQSTTIFRVNDKPTISTIAESESSSDAYGQGAKNRLVTVTGGNFQEGLSFQINDLTGMTLHEWTRTSATEITARVTLNEVGANPPLTGQRTVTITNPDFGTVTSGGTSAASGLGIADGPKVTAVQPPSRGRGQTVQLTIKGEKFATGANAVDVVIQDFTVTPGSVVVVDSTTITLTGTVSNALNVSGPKSVTVLNKGNKGEHTCISSCFAVDNFQTDSISPTSVFNDAPQQVTIAGSGLSSGASVTLIKSGTGAGDVPDIASTSNTVNQAGTSLTATLPLTGVAPGTYAVRVTNGAVNPGTSTCTCTLTVVASAPSITSVSPDDRGAGAQDETIVITGTNFYPGAKVEFDNAGITLVSAPVVTPTQITVVVDVASTAFNPANALDPEQVKVTNTDGLFDEAAFTVNRGPGVVSVSPVARAQGTASTVTVNGSNFTEGAQILLSGTGVTVGPVTFTDSQVPDSDKLAATFTVAGDALTGARTVTIENPDGGLGTCATCTFTVNAKPTVTGVSPAKGARGATPSVTIRGTNFAATPTVTVSGTGVPVTNVTVVDPTTITATLSPAANADLTTRDVTVTNTDGGTATLPASFKVFTVPDAPTLVSATRGDGSATVTWTAPAFDGNDPLTGYDVVSDPATTTQPAAADATQLVFTGLTNGTAYKFAVVAKNDAGSSPASTQSAPVTPASAPGAPTNITVDPSAAAGAVTVGWTAPASTGGSPITGYVLTASPGGATRNAAADATSLSFDGLTNGTTYRFTVGAINDVGTTHSAQSAEVVPYTVPDAPTAVTGTPGNGAVTVSWTAPAGNGGRAVTGYTVTTAPGGATKQVDGSTTSVLVDGLTNGSPYTFTVFATNDRGAGAASAASDAVTPHTVPGAPTNVQGTPGDGTVTLTWEAPASTGGNPISEYVVTASPGGAEKKVNGDALTAVVDGLTNGTPYTFTVGAKNAAGTTTSPATAEITPRTVPGVPTSVAVARGDQEATVTWAAPASDGGNPISGYVVTVTPGNTVHEVASGVTSKAVTGLTNGTEYTFTVAAKNAAGTGTASDGVTATPAGLPAAPASVTATAGHAAATVSWAASAANGSPVTKYTVTSTPGGIVKEVTSGTSTTMTGLTDGVSYTFAVKPTNAVGTGPATTSNAVTPTAITTLGLTATTQVVAGNMAAVRGMLAKTPGVGVGGQPVRLLAKTAPATTFSTVANLVTAADGTFATSFRLVRGNVTWKAVYGGANGLDPSTSAERVTKVAYRVTAGYSLSGRTLTVTGGVSPNAAGRVIHLQYRRADGSAVTLSSVRVASNNTYRFVKSMAPGTYSLFVYLPANVTNAAGRSVYRSTTIR